MANDRLDEVTGRTIRKGDFYLEEDTWVVWTCEAEDGKQSSIRRKGEDPEYMISATGKRFRCCTIDGEHEPQNMGEFTGRYLDALRFMHEVLGFEPYSPFDRSFEDHEEDEDT